MANTNLVENSVTQALSLWNKSRCWVKQPRKEEQKQLGFRSHIPPELWWNTTLDEMVSMQYKQFASKLQIGLKPENLNNLTEWNQAGVQELSEQPYHWQSSCISTLIKELSELACSPSGIQGRTHGLILVELCPLQELGTGSLNNLKQVWKQNQLNWQ